MSVCTSFLTLPAEVILLVAENLSFAEFVAFISVDEIFNVLRHDIKLVSLDPHNPFFFKFNWSEDQLIQLTPNKQDDIESEGKRPLKKQKRAHPGRIFLVEIPDLEAKLQRYDLKSDIFQDTSKTRLLAISSKDLEEESTVSFKSIAPFRPITYEKHELTNISFFIQNQVPEFLQSFPNSQLIIPNLKYFTSFKHMVDPLHLHFPDLTHLCLIDSKLPKSLFNTNYKLYLPCLQTLIIEENSQVTSSSILKIIDFLKYPSIKFQYFDSTFIRPGDCITSFTKDLIFNKLEGTAILESITSWSDIKFPCLNELLISTTKKTDHTVYSSFNNIEASVLKKFRIEYDCQHFPRISNIKLPRNTIIQIKAICNILWVHHHDTTLISKINGFLNDYYHLELLNCLDLLGCSPLQNLKTLKVICDGFYWHVSIMTAPKLIPNLKKLIINLNHDTIINTLVIPAPILRELKVANFEGPSYSLAQINKLYPSLRKLQTLINERETKFMPSNQYDDDFGFKSLESLVIFSSNGFALNKLLIHLNKFSFPNLTELTIIDYNLNDLSEFTIENMPKLQILNLHNSILEDDFINFDSKTLKIFGFPSLKILSFPYLLANIEIDTLSNLKKIILPDNDNTFFINDYEIDDDLIISDYPDLELETAISDNLSYSIRPPNNEFTWPNYMI